MPQSTSAVSISASGPIGGGSTEVPLRPPTQSGISTRIKIRIKRQRRSSPGQGLSSLLHAGYCLG